MKNIILVGKAASGKDYFKDFLLKKGYKTSISHTTRPKREGEINGVTYHYTNNFMFKLKVLFGFFYEHKKFNGWLYGTSKEEMKKSNVFIFTPSGVQDLPIEFTRESIIVYFDVNEKARRKRLEKRSDADTIERRLKADEKDFKDFQIFDLRVTGSFFDCDYTLKKILAQ